MTEEQTADAFRSLTRQMHDSGIRAARLNAVFIPLVLFFGTMAVSIVLLRGGYMVLNQALELATLSAFTTYAVSIFDPIQMTAANLAEFISLQASIERVTDLMDEQPQIQDTPEVIEKYGDAFHPKRENWEPLRGEIEFRDVTFRYPDGGENVLEHFSLHIPQGTTVAIVGETGAGKSTLINLACRFFEPTEGHILIDGVDYRQRSQLWLHSNIGYVLQNPHLSPAASGRTSATASWTPPTRRWRPPHGPCRRIRWCPSWKMAGTAMWVRAATVSPPARSS